MIHNKRADYFFLILTVVSILFMSTLISAGRAEAAVEIGKFSQVEGKVDVLKEGELPAIPAKAGDKVFIKNVIRTKSNSKAEILFSDGNILKIDQRSRVDISEYVSEDAKGKRIIKLPRGKVEASVLPAHAKLIENSPKTHTFEIHTPNAVAGVRGTKYRVLHINNITWVFVFDGSVNVFNPKFPDVVQVVNAGFMIMIPANDPAQPPKPLDPKLMGLDLNSAPPPTGTETGTTQTDTVVVEPVADDITPPYIPPPPPGTAISFGGIVDSDLGSASTGKAFGYYDDAWRTDPYWWGGLYGTGGIFGSLSGSTDSWSNPAPFTASGIYSNTDPRATLFGVPFEGFATDNTAFVGGMGGRIPNNQIEGRLLGLYIRPDHTAGIFFSNDMTGTHDSGDTGTWMTSGTLNFVDMGTTTYLPADFYWDGPAGDEGEWEFGSVENVWDTTLSGTAHLSNFRIRDQYWGILFGDMGNIYSATPPQDWDMELRFNEYAGGGTGPLEETVEIVIKGIEWANNKLSGKFLGYWANMNNDPDNPITGILVGETLGTFDPNGATKTWQAMNMGYIIETNTFLSMVQTAAGQAALQKLHIPSVEIGRANLTGSYANGSTANINMNDVIFFASSAGSTAPAIWATGNVNGTYTGNPGGVTVPLSGNGLNANFNIANWDTTANRWLATIDGDVGGVYSGTGSMNGSNIKFTGAGTGTFTGTTSGSLSGTAAGLAKINAP